MQHKAKYVAVQYSGLFVTLLVSALSSDVLCGPKVEWSTWSPAELLWLDILAGCQFLFCSNTPHQLLRLHFSAWSHSSELTDPETIALLDLAFCKHFKAAVFRAVPDFVLIFCNNEYIKFKSFNLGVLSCKLNPPITYGVGEQVKFFWQI
jgi:hypothetical protein